MTCSKGPVCQELKWGLACKDILALLVMHFKHLNWMLSPMSWTLLTKLLILYSLYGEE